MKNLILINGTMGVGKTVVSKALNILMPKSVMLDGDWCWSMQPFVVTDETKAMVMNNITYTLNNFCRCSEFENIIFCWVMHEESIIDDVVSRIDTSDIKVYKFSLVCDESVLIEHISGDIKKGLRDKSVIERSVPRLANYYDMDTVKINVGVGTPNEIAAEIKRYVMEEFA